MYSESERIVISNQFKFVDTLSYFSLKTSPWTLKFKPNFDSAAYEYERAAICFKNAGR